MKHATGESPANLQKYLKGIHYPAKKENLIDTAKKNNAPGDIMELINQIPSDEYGGPQDVMKAYGKIK